MVCVVRCPASVALAALALLVFAAPVVAATNAKKVETERIVVDPAKPDGTPKAATGEAPKEAAKLPEVHYGVEGLPPLVAKTRTKILEAAYSGDMDKLKVAIQTSETPVVLSVNEIGDPIEYLKSQSGDGDGREILAIITDLLESGWTKLDAGGPNEMYIWPYFSIYPIDKLEPKQLVEMFKVVTSSDFEEMKSAGKYMFYTLGIGKDGTWHYFKLND